MDFKCHLFFFFMKVLGDKWSYLKENEKKRMEKKKEYRTVEEAKKEVYEKPLNKINYKKKNNKKSALKKDETFLKDEVVWLYILNSDVHFIISSNSNSVVQ